MDSTVRTSEKYRWWGYVLSRQEILQVRFCLCIVLIVHWIFMNPIRNPAIKFFRAKVVFEIIDSNNSTNIAEINNSFVVIDSHLSTRVSKKRTNAFSLSYINAWKKKYVTTYIRKRREKKETQSNSIFHGSVTQRFVFCFVSFRFFSPPSLVISIHNVARLVFLRHFKITTMDHTTRNYYFSRRMLDGIMSLNIRIRYVITRFHNDRICANEIEFLAVCIVRYVSIIIYDLSFFHGVQRKMKYRNNLSRPIFFSPFATWYSDIDEFSSLELIQIAIDHILFSRFSRTFSIQILRVKLSIFFFFLFCKINPDRYLRAYRENEGDR